MRFALDSRDAIERRDAVRSLVRRLASAREILDKRLASLTNHSPVKWCRLQEMGERAALPLADLAPLVEELGVGMLEPFARLARYRMVPEVRGVQTQGDLLTVVTAIMREAGEALAEVAASIPDGVTPSELERILGQFNDLRRAMNVAEARLAASAVTPINPNASRR